MRLFALLLVLGVLPARAGAHSSESHGLAFRAAAAPVLEFLGRLRAQPLRFTSAVPKDPARSGADLPNFAHSGGGYYRGGQPSPDGVGFLKKLDIATVLDLRNDPKPFEGPLVESLGMRYLHIPMSEVREPTDSQIRRFTAILEDPSTGPVFVHCKRGADRTGIMSAIRRMKYQGWKPRPAAEEMISFRAVSPLLIRFVFVYYKRLHPEFEIPEDISDLLPTRAGTGHLSPDAMARGLSEDDSPGLSRGERSGPAGT